MWGKLLAVTSCLTENYNTSSYRETVSDRLAIALVVCSTILILAGMLRSTLNRLAKSNTDTFTFSVRFFGAELKLVRGVRQNPRGRP